MTHCRVQSNATAPPSNAVFDHSGHFLLYPTLAGVKLVNLETNSVVRVLGTIACACDCRQPVPLSHMSNLGFTLPLQVVTRQPSDFWLWRCTRVSQRCVHTSVSA